jgi:DNA-binding GntR family transcriptional regulator
VDVNDGRDEVDREGSVAVADRLRAAVVAGRLAPGSRLVELHLAREYCVSRASIRAAIGELAKEGLVDREVNRGATVRRIALDEAIQITEVRALLETWVVRRAAVEADESERRDLRAIVAEMRVAVGDDRLADYAQLNTRLHRRLLDIGHHAIASEVVANLRNRASSHEFRLAVIPGRAAESLVQHEAIVDAVVAADAVGAEEAMREHLDSVIAVLRRWETFGGHS